MRRRNEIARKLRVKILEDRRDGLRYSDIERKRGVSSRTIANLVKGKDPKRFCQMCGETEPEKLEEHHPDKVNDPGKTVTLCASCHAKLTREQQKLKGRKPERTPMREASASQQLSAPPPAPLLQQINPTALGAPVVRQTQSVPIRPLTPEERRFLCRMIWYAVGGVSFGEAVGNKKLPWWAKLLLLGGTGFCVWKGNKLGGPAETRTQSSQTPKSFL